MSNTAAQDPTSIVTAPPALDGISTFLIGAYTERMSFVDGHAEGITAMRHDRCLEAFSAPKLCAGVRNPSWVTLSPDGRCVYAVSEVDERDGAPTGGVHAFRRRHDDTLEPLNSMASGGMSPTHLAVTPDGRFLLVANFESGTLAVFELAPGGDLAAMRDVVQHHGRGQHDFFQAAPHPHQIVFDRLTGEFVVPDMGLDAIFFYELDAHGRLRASREPFKLPPGTGPRQVAFGPDDTHLMVLGEVNSTLNVLRRTSSGAFSYTQRLSTVPAGFGGKTRAGGLAVTPDRRRFFASNRGHDSVTVFSWDSRARMLCRQQTVACGGREPRGLAVTPDGRTLIVGNQDSDELVGFTIEATGLQLRTRTESPSPACILFLP